MNDTAPQVENIAERIKKGERRELPFGKHKWRVLDVQDNRALIISETHVKAGDYHGVQVKVTWEGCDQREYLNSEFLNEFSQEERERILETQVKNPNNLWYGLVNRIFLGAKGGNDTLDRVFLLSIEEADKYFGNSGDYLNKRRKSKDGEDGKYSPSGKGFYLSNDHDSDRQAPFDNMDAPFWWWLRSPGSDGVFAAYVDHDGGVGVCGYPVGCSFSPNSGGGIRPAMWLKLD